MNDDKVPAGKYAVSTSNRNFEGRQGPVKNIASFSYYGSSSSSYWKIDRSKRVDVKFFTARAQRRKELWKKLRRFSKEIFLASLEVHKIMVQVY
jgi:hypothetical protein